MPTGTRHYKLRIRTPDNSADLFIATSLRDGINPYIKEAPSGDGQTLDPLTGKTTIGAYTVRVIDAPGVAYSAGSSSYTDGWEYASQAAAESADWVFTDSMSTGSITVGAVDQVHGGSRSLKFVTTGNGEISSGGYLRATKTYTGLTADALYRVSVWGRMDARDSFDVHSRLYANGVERAITTTGAFQHLTLDVRASASGAITVTLERTQAFVNRARNIWWDDLTIDPLTPTTALEGRIVTSALADGEARQQLLSKLAYVEESEDEGATWTNLVTGYVNGVKLQDALLYEITVGESKRVEQQHQVFDRISDPIEHPLFIGTLDRASCLMGGPIVGDWGGFYVDRGRPAFEVLDTLDSDHGILNVGWTNDGGSLHAIYKEDGPPMRDYVAEFINDCAREYVAPDIRFATVGILDFALAPGLLCRIYDADTGDWVQDATCVCRRVDGAGFGTSDWGLVSSAGHFSIQWNGTLPSEGAKYRFAVFPKTTSDRNPMHWSGHPMDLVANVLDYIGTAYNLTSLQSIGAALGLDLKIHLRITQGSNAQEFLENTVYGPFGVAPRLNDAGELEFILTRNPDTVSSATITLSDLAGEPQNPWGTDESSMANSVIVETQSFIPETRRPDTSTPFDAIRSATITIPLKAETINEQTVYGDKEVRFTLPGSIQVGSEILSTGNDGDPDTVDRPGSLDLWVANLAQPLFDWQGRGAIRGEFELHRGVTDANIGDVLSLNLPYLPSANTIQSPVSQRGTDVRRAVILRRTLKPDTVAYLWEDRGLDEALDCLPTFTLAADADFPKTTVAVTVTNEVDLENPVRVEMAIGASEPAGNGQFVRLWRPNRDANPFTLPPVCAGNVVWVRMRCELNGQVGDWSDWDSLDLADLTAPSDLAAVVTNTSIALTWTNGETTYPVEVLARLTADTTMQSVAVLPAGSTAYTLQLTQAESNYTLGVRYLDPKGCTSSTTTLGTATDVAVCLDPPTNLAAFADGAGTYGVELDAAVIPGGVNIYVATETAVGSGAAGTYTLLDAVPALAPPLRTRWTVPTPAPNDGLLRYLKTESTQAGYTACDFSSVVSVNPWTLVEPVDPGDPDDPTVGAEAGVTMVLYPIPLLRDAYVLYQPDADRAVVSPWRVSEEYPDLSQGTAVYLTAGVVASTLPAGAYLACEVEAQDEAGNWFPMQDDSTDDTLTGPVLALDSTSLDALDDNADEAEWTVKGDAITLRTEAQGPVRVRLVTGGGDATGAAILSWATLWVRQGPSDVIPDDPHDGPVNDPGSCDTPSSLDAMDYADTAALDLAWQED